ncbi:hypothetical protein LZ554_009362 [Drepanopeziza brunnea f. sp. 'monogermtubi']|nr:hypothetical protein LZ554_009362 [Drepanopeziza brunnea f. sp. 'monogermtubi']
MSDLLYHVKRTITNFADDKSGATRVVDVLGTFTDLAAAKLAANAGLASEGYVKDDFEVYEQKSETALEQWKHADGVTIFARAPAGQEFEVCLDTKPNTGFKGNVDGEVEGHLHYVLQTTIDYNNDRIGGIQTTEVEGTYPTRAQAFEAAKTILLDNEVKKADFARTSSRASGPTATSAWSTPSLHACKHHEGKKCECECQHGDAACKAKQCKHDDCECSGKSH